jgi:hypothetical protein
MLFLWQSRREVRHDHYNIMSSLSSSPSHGFGRMALVLSALLTPFLPAPLRGESLDFKLASQANDLKALDGEWIYLEDVTEGRALEQMNPPMGSKFTFKTEDAAVILVWGHGGSRRDVRVTLDGSVTEVAGQNQGEVVRYKGAWKEGAFSYEIEFLTATGEIRTFVRREFKVTPEGMIVRSNLGAPRDYASIGLYKQVIDIPMPTPAKATITDVAWLAGNWSGSRGTNGTITFEERWSPPKGGSMLAVSRTVSRDRLTAFEYLSILERDGGLVYFAQPSGAPATEFVMTEFSAKRAVFDNPRHDYPKRIIYELTESGGLTATIGYMKGGSPRRFEFKREPN